MPVKPPQLTRIKKLDTMVRRKQSFSPSLTPVTSVRWIDPDRWFNTASDMGNTLGFTWDFFTWEYLSRVVTSFCLCSLAGWINATFACISGYRTPLINIEGPNWAKQKHTLPDLGHDLVEYLFEGSDILDWAVLPHRFANLMILCAVVFSLIHPKRLLVLRRFLVVFAILSFLRGICVLVTSMPDPSLDCRAQFEPNAPTGKYKNFTVYEIIWDSMLRAPKVMYSNELYPTCGDMIFSGHTVLYTCCYMIFHQYCYVGQECNNHVRTFEFWITNIMRKVMFVIWFFACCSVITTKLHFTIDVILAAYLTITCWKWYHVACEIEKLRNSNRFLKWMEAEVILNVDKKGFDQCLEKQAKLPTCFAPRKQKAKRG